METFHNAKFPNLQPQTVLNHILIKKREESLITNVMCTDGGQTHSPSIRTGRSRCVNTLLGQGPYTINITGGRASNYKSILHPKGPNSVPPIGP